MFASIRFALAAFLTLTLGSGAPCAIAQKAEVITFNGAIRTALEHNATLRQAQISTALDDVAVSEARMQFTPDLRLGASGAQNFGRNFNQTEGRVVEQTTESLGVTASSGLTLFNGFHDVAALRQAKFGRAAGRRDLDRAEETVVFTVASNFLALVQRQEQLRVQRENLAAEAQLERQIQNYVEAGARATADLYQQQASTAAARLAVVEAESAAALAQVDLMRTLQLDPAGNYEFQIPKEESESGTEEGALKDLLARAMANRSDLEAERARTKASEQGVWVARAGYWPTLSLNAGYGSAYTSASPVDFNEQLDLQKGGSVGLGLSIPLFERNSTHNASRRARLQALSARVTLENAQQEVGLQVRRAHLDYRAAREQLTAAEAQQRAAERAVQTSEERFKAGVTTLVELSQARARYVQAESALANARSNLLFQRTVMDYATGDLDPKKFTAE